jgi:hypothetical protein
MAEEMDAAKVRLQLGQALQSHVIRSTSAAFENLHDAIAALETLPVPAIEALRDYVAEEYGKREGLLGNLLAPMSSTWKRRWPPRKSWNGAPVMGSTRWAGRCKTTN